MSLFRRRAARDAPHELDAVDPAAEDEEGPDPFDEDTVDYKAHPNYPDTRVGPRDWTGGLGRFVVRALLVGWLVWVFAVVTLSAIPGGDPSALALGGAGGPVGGSLSPNLSELLLLAFGLVLKRQNERTEALAGRQGPSRIREQNRVLRDQQYMILAQLSAAAKVQAATAAQVDALRDELRGVVTELVTAADAGQRPAAARRRQHTGAVPAVPPARPVDPLPAEQPDATRAIPLPPPVPEHERIDWFLTAEPPDPASIALPPVLAARAVEATFERLLFGDDTSDEERAATERSLAEQRQARLLSERDRLQHGR